MTSGSEELIVRLQRTFVEVLNMVIPSPDTDLIETGRLDSLALVELLFELEQQFKVDIALEDLDIETFRSVRRIAEFIDSQQVDGTASTASS
jgi:D-alanine--poly(phosphoribitol) ligase subunit 2